MECELKVRKHRIRQLVPNWFGLLTVGDQQINFQSSTSVALAAAFYEEPEKP